MVEFSLSSLRNIHEVKSDVISDQQKGRPVFDVVELV